MSIDSTISIKLTNKISAVEIIKSLMTYGWTLNDYGKVSYLPLGDNDDFNWQSENISIDTLFDIVRNKELLGEMVGVMLTWEDSLIGGSFLFDNDKSVMFNICINRKKIIGYDDYNMTNVNWYIERLIPAINSDRTKVEAFTYKQF